MFKMKITVERGIYRKNRTGIMDLIKDDRYDSAIDVDDNGIVLLWFGINRSDIIEIQNTFLRDTGICNFRVDVKLM